ncbi:MAG: hypothetical protein QM775_16815 [Pirellulales bacterium]
MSQFVCRRPGLLQFLVCGLFASCQQADSALAADEALPYFSWSSRHVLAPEPITPLNFARPTFETATRAPTPVLSGGGEWFFLSATIVLAIGAVGYASRRWRRGIAKRMPCPSIEPMSSRRARRLFWRSTRRQAVVYLTIVCVAVPIAPLRMTAVAYGADGVWQQTGAGPYLWNDAANWLASVVPKNPGDRALLDAIDLSTDQVINIDTSVFLTTLRLGDLVGTSSYTLAPGAGLLRFDNRGAPALLIKSGAGTDVISSGVALDDHLTINVQNTGGLTISGIIANGTNGAKRVTIANSGTGVLTLSGANTFSGGLVIAGGHVAGRRQHRGSWGRHLVIHRSRRRFGTRRRCGPDLRPQYDRLCE